MKKFRKLMAMLCVLTLIITAVPQANAQRYEDSVFEGKTWEEVMDEFKKEHSITEDYMFSCGYKNLVTGEEYFINPEQYMDSASLYKVPMNMIFSNKVYTGEIDWDKSYNGYRYSYIQEATIVNSNNELAAYLWNALGGYQAYRRILAPICGENPDTVDAMFYKNNFFTSKQVIFYLAELHANSYKYPGVIDMMLKAEPSKYFKVHEHDVEIAHKYGYNTTDYHLYLNDSAICYTEDPIAIVCFTDNVSKPYEVLADYCDMMIDYAQYSRKVRIEREAKEAETAAIEALNASKTQETAAVSQPNDNQSTQPVSSGQQEVPANTAPAVQTKKETANSNTTGAIILMALIAVLAVAAIVFVLIKGAHKKLNTKWAILAIIVTAAALMVYPYSLKVGSKVKTIEANPQETVTQFFDSIIDGKYTEAYGCLYEYNDLGLQNKPATVTGEELYNELRSSYSYKLYGDSEIVKDSAVQPVLFTHLDLKALKADLQEETEKIVESMVASRPENEIYGDGEEYLPSFLDEAYAVAVKNLLNKSDSYLTTTGLNINLIYNGGVWKISGDTALLNALCGGSAY